MQCAAAALSWLNLSAHNDITKLQDVSRLCQRHNVCLSAKDTEHHTLWIALIYQPNVLEQVCSSTGLVVLVVMSVCCRLQKATTIGKKELLQINLAQCMLL